MASLSLAQKVFKLSMMIWWPTRTFYPNDILKLIVKVFIALLVKFQETLALCGANKYVKRKSSSLLIAGKSDSQQIKFWYDSANDFVTIQQQRSMSEDFPTNRCSNAIKKRSLKRVYCYLIVSFLPLRLFSYSLCEWNISESHSNSIVWQYHAQFAHQIDRDSFSS